MKIKTVLVLFFIFAFAAAAFSQSVVITSKKITYRRPKPLMDFKRTFTVDYPKVKAATAALSKKIEATISYQKVNNLNIKEEITEIQWLEEAGYEVIYNDKNILTITLSLNGTGAYPSVFSKTVVVDLRTGNRVLPADIFQNLEELAAAVKEMQRIEMKTAVEEYKKDPDAADFDASEYFENADFTIENLKEFAVDEKGVTFIYDYGFPHVALALEPEGRYSFSWAQLNAFIKRDGLLAQFVR